MARKAQSIQRSQATRRALIPKSQIECKLGRGTDQKREIETIEITSS